MKQWQVRGEVLDSDEEHEALSLGSETASPERPPKRFKVSDSGPDLPTQILSQQKSDGGLLKDSSYQSRSTRIDSQPSSEVGVLPLTSNEIPPLTDHDVGSPLQPQLRSSLESTDAEVAPRSSVKKLQAVLIQPFGTNSEVHTQDEPVVYEEYRLDISGNLLGQNGYLSDDSSSVLSEREISTPPGFRFLNPATQAPREKTNPGRTELPVQDVRRRNFRTRKEIQLHPYLLDRAEYLKQCRQRGMRPVRLQEQPHSLEESQDVSLDANSDNERLSSPPHQSPANTSSTAPAPFDPSLGYFELATQYSDAASTPHQLPKRRRIKSGAKAISALSQSDVLSLPPSPPRSGSQLATPAEPVSRKASPRFRLPFGMVTAQPLTPQMSSDIKHSDTEDESSSDSLPRRRSRFSTVTKISRDAVNISSSEDSSSSKELEIDMRRLRREQKRIKGVLPASWLKLDFRKRQEQRPPSPMRLSRQEVDSPAKESPRKGIAQKIQPRRSHQASRTALSATLENPENDEQNSDLDSKMLSPQFRLPRFHPRRSISARSQTIDEDVMENDWFDPMFAGSSRGTRRRKERHTKQPRITEVLNNTSRSEAKFSNERTSVPLPRNALAEKRSMGKKKKPKARISRDTPLRLSIIDAPRTATLDESNPPQFIRVALRQTRHQENLGRHSPTNKIIRMTTEHDTEDALSVLRAWRQGKLNPIRNSDLGVGEPENHYARHSRPPVQRTQLAEQSSNVVQPSYSSLSRSQVSRTRESASNAHSRRRKPPQIRAVSSPVNDLSNTAAQSENPTPKHGQLLIPAHLTNPKGLFPRAARVRGAQIETLASEFDNRHRATAFERRMQQLTDHAAKLSTRHKASELHSTRFRQGGRVESEDNVADLSVSLGHVDQHHKGKEHVHRPRVTHKSRKTRASRIDAEAREYRQPDETVPPMADSNQDSVSIQLPQERHDTPVLLGLNDYGTRYSTNFDVRPLPFGVYFHASTFIGSGDFHKALRQTTRDLHKPAGPLRVQINGLSQDWGSWTEDVATGFNQTVEMITSLLHEPILQPDELVRQERCEHVNRTVNDSMHSVVRYCFDHLWFADPVDRRSCCESLHRLVVNLMDTATKLTTDDGPFSDVIVRIRQYCLVIASQALQLCDHRLIDVSVQEKTRQLMLLTADSLARCTIPVGLKGLQSFYEDVQRSAIREAGINDRQLTVTTIVLLQHTLGTCKSGVSFWQLANASFDNDVPKSCDASAMEKLWYGIFTVLPALGFDSTGIAKADKMLGQTCEDWSLVRSMLVQVLDVYENSSLVRGSTINDYVRSLLARCHLLVNKWGWWRCEQLLGSVYDFFAHRDLAFLNHEESHGSPRFIEHLVEDPPLEIDADDRSFHIFLKILATGLRGMQKHNVYDNRKIGGIAWRFIPSHGRTYRKDVEMRTSDLNALRNHFDLLITLYFASPAGHRPRVDLLRNLVDHETSHREACRLSVRAWTSLATFQTSTLEPADSLRPLIEWFNDIFKSAIGQYRLARSEAEHDVEIAKEQGAFGIPSAVVENIVAKNEQQIAATLVDALAGLKRVFLSSRSVDNVLKLSVEAAFTAVFELFDPTQQRLSSAVTEALNVADTALDRQQKFRANFESQHASDDSQDFGDSSALQEFVAGETNDCTVSQVLHDPISQFLSNVLGADECAEDKLTQNLIDIWIRLIADNVTRGEVSWISYVDDYSPHSWNRLRDTLQKRKFTPYFMARVIDHAGHELDIKQEALTIWILSLVEREAVLKYQHVLTSALLGHCFDDPLLRCLPFTGYSQRALSNLTLDDLRQRRLGLIAGILSNMRENCEEANGMRSTSVQERRMGYAGILRRMMQAMKANYQDLQASYNPRIADGNVRGSYVDFVHQVITILQQHTTEISPIDRFFTDSAAFPLPATDPTYVIGRLRSYAPKLSEAKTRKQLAIFVQTVSERAAADAQQAYLVDQFTAAMTGDGERGDSRVPSLRHVLLTSIFPAYYHGLVLNRCDWILALPMLDASERVLDDLLYSIDIDNEQSVAACVQILHITVRCANRQCTLLLSDRSISWRSQTYRSVTKLFDVARACLVLVSYIDRCTKLGREAMLSIHQLHAYCRALKTQTNLNDDGLMSALAEDEISGVWPDTKTFAANQVRSTLDQNWSIMDDHYEVRRGNSRKEVMIHLEDVADERDRLMQAMSRFTHSYDAVFNLRIRSKKGYVGHPHLGLADLVI